MKRFFALGKTRWAVAVFFLIAVVLWIGFLLQPSTPPPFATLQQPFSRPLPLRDRLVSWIPGANASALVWHLENLVFGKRKPVNINGEIVAVPAWEGPELISSLGLRTLLCSDPAGLQTWLLASGDIEAVRQRFKKTPGVEFLSRPRISTADGVEASLFCGASIPLKGVLNHIGLKMNCFGRLRGHSTDLYTLITYSEAVTNRAVVAVGAQPTNSLCIQTNLDIAARVQIPKGSGVLFIKSSPNHPSQRTFGVLLETL